MSGLFMQRHAFAVEEYDTVSVIHLDGSGAGEVKNQLEVIKNGRVTEYIVYYSKSRLPLLKYILNGWRYFNYSLKAWNAYRRVMGKPDLVHVHVLTRAGVVALYLKIRYKIPYMITEHWSRYLPGNRKDYSGFFRHFMTNVVVRN